MANSGWGLSPLLVELMEALRCLPGIGPRSAQRMVFHLLQRRPEAGLHLAETLKRVIQSIRQCTECRNFTEQPICTICRDSARDPAVLCILGSPADLVAIEQTGGYRGYYFVLMGLLSPIEGIGPDALGFPLLKKRVADPHIQEVIIATNPTVEGEATAYYIQEMLREHPIRISRLAHGVPLGGELEYIDGGTLLHALSGRILMEDTTR